MLLKLVLLCFVLIMICPRCSAGDDDDHDDDNSCSKIKISQQLFWSCVGVNDIKETLPDI